MLSEKRQVVDFEYRRFDSVPVLSLERGNKLNSIVTNIGGAKQS